MNIHILLSVEEVQSSEIQVAGAYERQVAVQAKYVGYSTDTGKNMTMAFGIFFFLLKSVCRRVKKVFFMNPGRLRLRLGDFRLVSLATLNRNNPFKLLFFQLLCLFFKFHLAKISDTML